MAINPSVYKNLPYDPTKDLMPLSLVFDANDASGTVGNYNYFSGTRTLFNTPPTVSLPIDSP